jgi:hypothetical protein
MESNNKNIDIIYFIKNVLQINLLPYEELFIKKIIEVKKSGEDLIFMPVFPRTLHEKILQSKYYGTNAKVLIIDDLDG